MMPGAPDPQAPEARGSALAVGLTLAVFLAFACFVMGAVTAGAGVSDLRQSQAMNDFGVALALGVVGYALHFAAERLAEQPAWAMAARIGVIPIALAAIFMFGVGITHILAGQTAGPRVPPETAVGAVYDRDGAQMARVARFERLASAAIAFVSLAAAIAALVNEVRRGP